MEDAATTSSHPAACCPRSAVHDRVRLIVSTGTDVQAPPDAAGSVLSYVDDMMMPIEVRLSHVTALARVEGANNSILTPTYDALADVCRNRGWPSQEMDPSLSKQALW